MGLAQMLLSSHNKNGDVGEMAITSTEWKMQGLVDNWLHLRGPEKSVAKTHDPEVKQELPNQTLGDSFKWEVKHTLRDRNWKNTYAGHAVPKMSKRNKNSALP